MIDDIIMRLNSKGISLSLNGNKLKVSADSKLLEEDLAIIRTNKPLIVQYIKRRTDLLTPILRTEEQSDYAVSSAQRRLWVLQKIEGVSNAYNIPYVLKLVGTLNLEAFQKAYLGIICRHESFRTVFLEDGEGNPRQRILSPDDQRFYMIFIDYTDYNDETKETSVENYVRQEVDRVFNLSEGPLIRSHLLKTDDDSYVWVLVMHHIVSDGWSMDVLEKEMSELYNAQLEGRLPVLNDLGIQYKDYSAWQITQLNLESMQEHQKYWLDLFSGEIPVIELTSNGQRPKEKSYMGSTINRVLGKLSVEKLRDFVHSEGGSMFMVLQTAIVILLHKYTGQEDIIIGSPSAGRDHPDLEGQIGFFVNTIVFRNKFKSSDTFQELYNKIKENCISAYSHQSYPYDELVGELKLSRDVGRNPLFDILISYRKTDSRSSNPFRFTGIELADYHLENGGIEIAKFDLSFGFDESSDKIEYSINYNTSLFNSAFISTMMDHLCGILDSLPYSSAKCLEVYSILSQNEIHRLVQPLGEKRPEQKTAVQLFEEKVIQYPDKTALKYLNTELTYKELNEWANKLSHYLMQIVKVNPDDLIGVELERNEWIVISILAVIKTGGAYVPIDIEYPDTRKDFIKNDGNIKFVFNARELKNFKEADKKNNFPNSNINSDIKSTDLMYVMYTSGSTGKPKGVMVEHSQWVSFIKSNSQYFFNGIYNNEVVNWFAVTNYTFDISTFELIGSLIYGFTLNLIQIGNVDSLFSEINANPGGILQITPSHLEMIVVIENSHTVLPQLKTLLIGGESMGFNLISFITKYLSNIEVFNVYGPTETTVWSTGFKFGKVDTCFLGLPLAGEYVYILNKNLKFVPNECVGQICIGGSGITRGYLNRPELTKNKFIHDPFREGEKIYLTGDLGRWNQFAELEFVGRTDDQVKIRGQRIELGELEKILNEHAGAGKVVVVAKNLREKSTLELIVYYTGMANPDELKKYLMSRTPSYMVPNYYIHIETIPLTNNGKTDRKALPEPEFRNQYLETKMGQWIDRQLQLIWSQILKINQNEIPLNVDFFHLGGNSLKMIYLTYRINDIFSKNLRYRDVLENSTIIDLRKLINNSNIIEGKTFYRLNEKKESGLKMLLLPPGGGEGLIFKKLASALNNVIEIWTVDYTSEIFVDLKEFAIELSKKYKNEFSNCQLIIGGYSLGMRVAYHMALNLENQLTEIINIDSMIFLNQKDKFNFIRNYLPNSTVDNKITIEDDYKNDFFIDQLKIPVIHFIGNESYVRNYIPLFISKDYKLFHLDGNHDDIMDNAHNIEVISTYIIDKVNG